MEILKNPTKLQNHRTNKQSKKTKLQIKWQKQTKYLGCQLTNLPNQNTIIPYFNYAIFRGKYRAKHAGLLALSYKYQNISLPTKLNLVKTFALPYSNLFAQIIPLIHRHHWELRIIHMTHVSLFLDFNTNSKNHCITILSRILKPQMEMDYCKTQSLL